MHGAMARSTFTVSEDRHEGVVHLRPAGDLDLATAHVVRRRLDDLREEGAGVVLDLGGLSFMGSEGVHLISAAQRTAGRDGWHFSACNPSPQASLVLRACDMQALVAA